MNNIPLSYFQKDCLVCGKMFYKSYYCSKKEWEEKRKFCSRICADKYWSPIKTERLKKHRFQKGCKPAASGNRGKKGKENSYWKENPSYNTLHRWLIDNYKKTGKCNNCGNTAKTQWARVSKKYTRNIEDYRELCSLCHIRYDSGLIELNCL